VTPITTLVLLKAVLLSGLSLWLAIVVLNNVTAFRNGVFSIGSLMGMKLFNQEPAIVSPLLSRSVESASWHRLIFSVIVLVEVAVALLLATASVAYFGTLQSSSDVAHAVVWANLALCGFVAMSLIMLLGGAWFAYYIRQEATQVTHLVLIAIGIAGAVLMNLPGL
jgi:predicted small integral membrane protein